MKIASAAGCVHSQRNYGCPESIKPTATALLSPYELFQHGLRAKIITITFNYHYIYKSYSISTDYRPT